MELMEFVSTHGSRQVLTAPKSLLTKTIGRFYTPKIISNHLVAAVLRNYESRPGRAIRLVDPFCGDGRLIAAFLEAAQKKPDLANKLWEVSLWDCDKEALGRAQEFVQRTASSLALDVQIKAFHCDSFEYAPSHFGKFDVVVTNPPWDVLKPDRREMDSLEQTQRERYVERLRSRDANLSRLYETSVPASKFAGWGLNLARVGSEAAFRLSRVSGVVGLVSPLGLLADQVSSGLRRWIFKEFSVRDIAYFPAEARLFENVDHSSITLVGVKGSANGVCATASRLSDTLSLKGCGLIKLTATQLEALDFTIPVHLGIRAIPILESLSSLPTFGALENAGILWAGRELDETRLGSFTLTQGEVPFIKGRMVTRYAVHKRSSLFLDTSKRNVPSSASYCRVAWRDVSRPSQKRRMHAALLPSGCVTGNSLHVAYFHDQSTLRSLVLLGVMNSLVFEFQVRARLATPHVSLGVVRMVRLPLFRTVSEVSAIAALVAKMNQENEDVTHQLEISIARAYGLSREMFARLLDSFEKLSLEEKRLLLDESKWKSPFPNSFHSQA